MNALVLPILRLAEAFAIAAHSGIGQVRRYTGEPYWHHCREVAALLAEYESDGCLIAAAWLHDVLEDTKVKRRDLEAVFPSVVVKWVLEVTDVSGSVDGNRAARKQMDREHLSLASPGGKSIKLSDLISNCRSISQHDPNFARVYLAEMDLLLPLLVGGNEALYHRANMELREAQHRLVQTALEGK